MAEPALMKLILTGDTEGLKTLLASDPELAKATDEQGISYLMQALYHRQAAMAAVLAEAKGSGQLTLFEAAAVGKASRVRQVLEATPDRINETAQDGFTALHLAAFFDHLDTVQFLLSQGADSAAVSQNPMKVTALHAAVASRSAEVVAALVNAGADVEAKQNKGYTALMGAASAGILPMVERLVAAGADVAVTSDDGKTAADLAREHGHVEIAENLEGLSQSISD